MKYRKEESKLSAIPLSFLLGQETEYAIRFKPAPGAKHPGNYRLFESLEYGIQRIVKTRPGERAFIQHQFFVENGGAFNYECVPYAYEHGLLEGATPECSSPVEALLYQRAQENLLLGALKYARNDLRRNGRAGGDLGLIKNCRDHLGNTYGAQENYETRPTSGLGLWMYRLTAGLFLPLYLLHWLVIALISLGVPLFLVISAGFCEFLAHVFKWLGRRVSGRLEKNLFFALWMRMELVNYYTEEYVQDPSLLEPILARILIYAWLPIFIPSTLALRLLVFRKQRRAMTAFLGSRQIFTGAGTLRKDGTMALGEKLEALRRISRYSLGVDDRPLFDCMNIQKELMLSARAIYQFRENCWRRYFAPPRRMQLGASDSNRAQFAEYLKFGTTYLVLRACEAGYLKDAPKLRRPIDAIRKLNRDPSLREKVRVKGGEELNALELQRLYLRHVRRYLKETSATSLEYLEIVRNWQSTLDALERDPAELIGRVDWVTKRYLIETAGSDGGFAVKKKIDIAYHELGSGYFEKLEQAGIAPRIVDQEAVEHAVHEPPSPESARIRAGIIKGLLFPGKSATISWNSARVGNSGDRRLISLDDYRRKRD